MSRGMVLVESLPERQVTGPTWTPASAHEAPPCGGILGITIAPIGGAGIGHARTAAGVSRPPPASACAPGCRR